VTTLLSSDAAAVLATTHAAELEFGLIETTGNTVTRIIEKPTIGQITSHSIWSGRVAFKSAVLCGLRNSADLAKDVFPNLLAQGAKVTVQNENEPWYDVGSIGHWRKANEDYRKRRLSLVEFK
jgi:NDP-sugar pyrophosphorylase family protein